MSTNSSAYHRVLNLSQKIHEVELQGNGLLLRRPAPQDIEWLFLTCSTDPEIARWTTVPWPYTREHAIEYVCSTVPNAWKRGTGALFIVVQTATEHRVGCCGLVRIDGTEAEIGCWTAEAFRGKGLTRAALQLVCAWARKSLAVELFVWRADRANLPSLNLARQLGFQFDSDDDNQTGATCCGTMRLPEK